MIRKALLPVLLAAALLGLPAGAQAEDLYHHLHLRSGDALASAQWYKDHMDCEEYGREGACMVDDIQIIFYTNEDQPTGPSVGTGVDHIGFSFRDLEAKMEGWKAAGVTVLEDIREVPGLFKLAFLEDPWGTKIEVVEDHTWLGFHHLHLYTPDPQATISWYESLFGGVPDKMHGRLAGLRYGGLWLLARPYDEEIAPTAGRSVDHLGWPSDDLEATVARYESMGIELDEPGMREVTNAVGAELKIAFVTSDDGVRIELVETVSSP